MRCKSEASVKGRERGRARDSKYESSLLSDLLRHYN